MCAAAAPSSLLHLQCILADASYLPSKSHSFSCGQPYLESHREGKSGKPSSSVVKWTRWKVTTPCFHGTKCFWILLPHSSRPLCLCMDCSPQPWYLANSYSTFKTLQRYHLLRKEFPDTFPPGPVLYFVHNACLYCTC